MSLLNTLGREKLILSPWPIFESDEIEAVERVLRSGKVNYWTGQEGRLFEKEFAEYVGTDYAVALHNGTVALELALYALGIGDGDEVITTPRTFIASASAIVMRGATPVFADVDRDSGLITAESIEEVITPKTKAIIVVHLAGWPADMDPIMELADRYQLKVIEDCAQAHGARYKGRSVGSIGHVGAWSFCQDKILTTGGEGGMITTNDPEIWSRAWSFKDHGKSYDAVYHRQHPPGFRWLHESFGTNWRMLEVQAAIGRVALRKLDGWVVKRRANAQFLSERLRGVPALRIPEPPQGIYHSYYRLYAYVVPAKMKPDWNRDRVLESIAAQGVPAFSGSCSEVYLEKAFIKANLQPRFRLPVAKELGETSLAFLVHPTLLPEQLEVVSSVTHQVAEQTLR
ncbi:MAG: DegT/DnrJ/EryC1/StrS family aminotransferase [Candidatus Brachytrichaceae bacterium NZ_4S206]|jgi:dTDP-4-amino-4,6-dideoxygalactose transaminase